jgi:hypothetical protein
MIAAKALWRSLDIHVEVEYLAAAKSAPKPPVMVLLALHTRIL